MFDSCRDLFSISFGRKGYKQGELNLPSVIAFGKNSCSIVVDTNNPRVQSFDEQGECLSQFGDKRNLDRQLRGPFGLCVDSNGNIIIANEGNKLIKTFSLISKFL